MESKKITIAANITYSGLTYNTRLFVEYKHTGKIFYCKEPKQQHYTQTQSEAISNEWKQKGLNVFESEGHYFIDRMAIPTINAKGERDIWYINNPGDSYSINKVSKFARKIHANLSEHKLPYNS